ncbi:hypothetical protein Tco_0841451 [Tanacetum coccineum]|uniref:Reverse transcriptase domain-containing protein n=1 Tax=Tanacetum coccineum TaxID=301880 RepID=A0ABQ5B0U2_9ASTR
MCKVTSPLDLLVKCFRPWGLGSPLEAVFNCGEPSRDRNVKDDNKRTRTRNAFATTVNLVRREYTSTTPNRGSTAFTPLLGIVSSNLGFSYEIKIASGFDVIIGIDWLSKHKVEIIFHEKVVRIPLRNGKTLRVISERPEEKVRHLKSAKAKEKRRRILSWLETFSRLRIRLFIDAKRSGGTTCIIYTDHKSLQHIFNQKEFNMRQHHWIELFSDFDSEIRYHTGKANVVADALSRKERIKPKRIRAMNMTLQSSIKDKILAAQKEASDESTGLQRGLDKLIERRSDEALYYLDRIWVLLKGDVRTLIMDEAHKSKYSVHPGADKMYYDLRNMY